MTFAIIITTYNRPIETKICFDSLRRAQILPNTFFIIVDDCSTDAETLRLINTFHIAGHETIVLHNPVNSSISFSLKRGYDLAWQMGCDIVMNLDNDCIVRNDFMSELIKLKMIWQNNIVTGFNCLTKNANGTERHKILKQGQTYNLKASVGGINMVLHKVQYENFMLPALNHVLINKGNWDHLTCINSMADNKPIVCLQPSVIQHQATQSSMGHLEKPDIAEDFKGLVLKDVTLICVDDNYNKAVEAIINAQKNIIFGNLKILSSDKYWDGKDNFILINPLNSKEAYSRFIMNELFKYVETSHVLIVQHDGYPVNYQSWDWQFLNYDYIGAPWGEEFAPYRVGNGGFSLRSQKLCRLTAGINWPITHPEDATICRGELRVKLETEYGVKFAPLELAEKFSYEGFNQPTAVFKQQFGFHNINLANELKTGTFKGIYPNKPAIVPRSINRHAGSQTPEGLIFNQFLGLGDILFLVPMARHYMSLGHDIVWPVADDYQKDLKRHFPDIQFVPKSSFNIQYDARKPYMHRWQYGVYKVLPLRWNVCNVADASDCMTGKYTMQKLDWHIWRKLVWQNIVSPHDGLCKVINNGQYTYEYELHCPYYGCGVTGGKKKKAIESLTGLPVVELTDIKGYSMLDWTFIMQNATVIHAVSSSTLYMLETLNLKAKEIHLYGRDNGMRDHVYVGPLRTKNYILHP